MFSCLEQDTKMNKINKNLLVIWRTSSSLVITHSGNKLIQCSKRHAFAFVIFEKPGKYQ